MWSKHIIWGNHMLRGGVLLPNANAWRPGVTWGAVKADNGARIAWGQACGVKTCSQAVWDATGRSPVWESRSDDNIVWGDSGDDDNIVWGSECHGNDCDDIVWGSGGDDNIVWGDSGDDNIVWGDSSPGDNVVWSRARGRTTPAWTGDNLPVFSGPHGETLTIGTRDLPAWLTDEMLFELIAAASGGGT